MTERQNAENDVPVGSTWQRNPPGREVVEVRRAWDYSALGDPAVPTIRAHPKRGGRPLVAPVEWFTERYTRIIPSADRCQTCGGPVEVREGQPVCVSGSYLPHPPAHVTPPTPGDLS